MQKQHFLYERSARRGASGHISFIVSEPTRPAHFLGAN
jgi:hypothetical protein